MTMAEVFFCESCEIFKNTFFTERIREIASRRCEITITTKSKINLNQKSWKRILVK